MSPRVRAVAIAAAALVAIVGTVVALQFGRDQQPSGPATAVDRSTELPKSITKPAQSDNGQPSTSPRDPGTGTARPSQVTIDSVGLEMEVQAEGVADDGQMALPDTAFRLAWYKFGPRPLDDKGAVVIAGHLDTKEEGKGPLVKLGEVSRGDRIDVRVKDKTVTYQVTAVTRIGKAVLDLPVIFSRNGGPRLHLITCGGAYIPDKGGYQDNVVVAARRISRG
jgi:LPXTG-site transpeptidase (sortase) family protein